MFRINRRVCYAVAGRHIDCITGAVLDLGTVVHLHDHGNNSGKFYHYDGSEYPW